MSGSWDAGKRIAGAAALAVEMVNANKDLLPLEYSWADSGCSAQKGLAAMGELLRGASKVDAVIGPSLHRTACEVTSYLSGGQGLPQVSWACGSPELSNKAQHRLVSLLAAAPYVRFDFLEMCNFCIVCSSRAQWHLRRAKDRH